MYIYLASVQAGRPNAPACASSIDTSTTGDAFDETPIVSQKSELISQVRDPGLRGKVREDN
jgi:hypothetical protein